MRQVTKQPYIGLILNKACTAEPWSELMTDEAQLIDASDILASAYSELSELCDEDESVHTTFVQSEELSIGDGGHDVDRSKNNRKVHSSHDSADPKVRESQTRRSSAAAGFLGIGTFTPGNGHDSRVPAIGHLFK